MSRCGPKKEPVLECAQNKLGTKRIERMGWRRDRYGVELPRWQRGGRDALSGVGRRSGCACDPALGHRLCLPVAGGAASEGALAEPAGDYLFSCATLEPRKNYPSLFKAFSKIVNRVPLR